MAGWANKIFVVDSGSTDRTKEIAEQHGATFVEHPWEGYAGPSTSRTITESALHPTCGFQDASPLAARVCSLPSVGETTTR